MFRSLANGAIKAAPSLPTLTSNIMARRAFSSFHSHSSSTVMTAMRPAITSTTSLTRNYLEQLSDNYQTSRFAIESWRRTADTLTHNHRSFTLRTASDEQHPFVQDILSRRIGFNRSAILQSSHLAARYLALAEQVESTRFHTDEARFVRHVCRYFGIEGIYEKEPGEREEDKGKYFTMLENGNMEAITDINELDTIVMEGIHSDGLRTMSRTLQEVGLFANGTNGIPHYMHPISYRGRAFGRVISGQDTNSLFEDEARALMDITRNPSDLSNIPVIRHSYAVVAGLGLDQSLYSLLEEEHGAEQAEQAFNGRRVLNIGIPPSEHIDVESISVS